MHKEFEASLKPCLKKQKHLEVLLNVSKQLSSLYKENTNAIDKSQGFRKHWLGRKRSRGSLSTSVAVNSVETETGHGTDVGVAVVSALQKV